MAIKYVPYFPNTLEGQALLDNFVRTKRILRYRVACRSTKQSCRKRGVKTRTGT